MALSATLPQRKNRMKPSGILDGYDLEHSLVIGYYGGGNYGDELLLEILENMFRRMRLRDITITYQQPHRYARMHHDFGYELIAQGDKRELLRAILKNRNIIIGGGGQWGMDMNFNVFLLSLLLFVSRHILRKNVYLLGVGYYDSTTRLGHAGAWLAGKAATAIVARDDETYENFRRITKHVSAGRDLAWHVPDLDLSEYRTEQAALQKKVHVSGKTLLVALRRFKPGNNDYTETVEKFLAENSGRPVIVALMEPHEVDPEGFKKLKTWKDRYPGLQIFDANFNPMALYLFLKKHRRKLAVIAPQFHLILTAQLAGVPFMPIVYDNKVSALLDSLGQSEHIPINRLKPVEMKRFANMLYEGS